LTYDHAALIEIVVNIILNKQMKEENIMLLCSAIEGTDFWATFAHIPFTNYYMLVVTRQVHNMLQLW